MVKRELKSTRKEKTIMLAIFIQLFIASFSSIILIGIMSFYDPTSIAQNTRITIEVGVVGDTSSPLLGFLRGRNLVVTPFPDTTKAEEAFQSGQVDTIIFIPESNTGVIDMKLTLPDSDIRETAILMVLNEPLKRYEAYLREANDVQLNYRNLGGKSPTTYEFLYSLIVPILMLFPAFIVGSIVIDSVSEEIETKRLDPRGFMLCGRRQVFGSKISAAVIMAVIQCIMWAILLRLNGMYIQNLSLVLLLSVIIAAFISVGSAIIALNFKDRERAQFIYSMVLLATVGLSYFLNPSPFILIARLATGDYYTGIYDVALYVIPLIVLSALFFIVSKKLVSAQS